MRRLIIAAAIVLLSAGVALAGWHYLRPRDPLAEARQLLAKGDVRAAELVLRGAVRDDPGRAQAHAQLARLQLRLGDPVAAEHEFRAAVEHGADATALRPLLAQAVVAQGHYEAVLRDYAPDGLPPEMAAEVLVARAEALLGLKRPTEAAAAIAEAQRLQPQSVEVALAAAKLALAQKDPTAALRHVDEALAIDPRSLEGLALQAQLRAVGGDVPGALQSYGSAIEQAQAMGAPGAVDALRVGRARLLVATNQDKPARTDVDAVLKAQPKQPMAQFLSAILFVRAGDWKAADAALAAVGPRLSQFPMGDLTLALVKSNLGQPEQALAAAERQVARTPDNLEAVKLAAKLELVEKQPKRAADVLTTLAAAGHPLDQEGLDLLGTAYASAGQPAQAVAALRQAVALNPDDARMLTRLAVMELRQGDPAQAEKALLQALDAKPAAAAATAVNATPPAQPGPTEASAQARTAAALVMTALQAGDIDQAVAALDRLKKAGGDPEQIAMLSGTVKLAQMDLTGAQAAFEDAARMKPGAPAPQIELARLLALQGHPDEAMARLNDILAADHANAPALAALINMQLAAGQRDKAVATALAAHQAVPDNTGIVAVLGALYIQAGEPQKTLDLLAATRKPDAPAQVSDQMAELQAQAQLAMGQPGTAAQTLRPLLDHAPDNVALRRQIAELLAADKKYTEARALLDEGLGRRPGDAVLLAGEITVAQREGGVDAALARIDELSRNPANAAVNVFKGDLLMSERRFAEAAATYLAVQKTLPSNDRGVSLLEIKAAQAVAGEGNADKASAMLGDWLKAHPGDADVALALASYDIAANRLPDARARLDAVLASQPNNAVALNNLAWVTQQQGDVNHAHALATRAYLLRRSPQSADTLGWILLAQGNPAGAVALLREAANSAPGDMTIHYHFAVALARDGQKDAAVALLKSLVDKPDAGFAEKPQAAKLLAELSP
jgi:tetratricopeptide (TPR) repeat protein